MYVYIYIYIYIYTHLYTYTHIHNMYTYIYIYTYTHTHIDIDVAIETCALQGREAFVEPHGASRTRPSARLARKVLSVLVISIIVSIILCLLYIQTHPYMYYT